MVDARSGAAKLPFVRGVASLVESLKLGTEALRFSAETLTEDWEDEERAKAASLPTGGAGLSVLNVLSALGLSIFSMTTDDGEVRASKKSNTRGPMMFMLAIVVLFFIALPQGLSAVIKSVFHLSLEVQSPQFQLLTGALKLTIVVGYLLLIRRIPDIRRVFQYHGAEHKTISTYEANEALVVANARTKTTLHPRCGTTFLVMVAIVSIVVFTGIGTFLPRIHTGSWMLDNLIFFGEKLPFLPLLAAITFELQRVFARYCTTGPLRALLWPGFLVQKITTIEPDDQQLEVALAALRATLFREEGRGGADVSDVSFPSYEAIAAAGQLRPAA
jgi:uncharacterized protein YqhQ